MMNKILLEDAKIAGSESVVTSTALHQDVNANVAIGASLVEVSIIVPTYGEAENLPVLVPRVAEVLRTAGISAEIVVVDDNSPDDTARVCEQLARDYPVRLLIRRDERGLSSAVLHGMKHARGKILLVMDADLSHPPERIPEIVATLQRDDTDFVIGSRYVKGGATDGDWGFFRWLNSKAATWLALPLTRARDPMAGFFAIRKSAMEAAEELDPIGYKIGLELMVKCRCRVVREVPIQFSDRLHGESKLTLKEQVNYLRHLKRLYEFKLGRLARPLKFCMVGTTGLAVDLSILTLLLTVTPFSIARALAIWVAMTWNFWLNRSFTFGECQRNSIGKQYVLFCLSCLMGAVLNWSISVGLCAAFDFFAQWKILAAIVGVLAGTAFNYLLSSRVVFRRAA
jgi:dolichol-phosphate mannosyltransferase